MGHTPNGVATIGFNLKLCFLVNVCWHDRLGSFVGFTLKQANKLTKRLTSLL